MDWHFAVTLENDKNIWLEFHLAHCMSWWLEGSLVGLWLGLSIGSPLESPNPGAVLPVMLLRHLLGCGLDLKQLGVSFSSFASWIAVNLLARGGGVCIYCVPPSGFIITYNMNSVRYFQLIEFLTLELSHTWLVTFWREVKSWWTWFI